MDAVVKLEKGEFWTLGENFTEAWQTRLQICQICNVISKSDEMVVSNKNLQLIKTPGMASIVQDHTHVQYWKEVYTQTAVHVWCSQLFPTHCRAVLHCLQNQNKTKNTHPLLIYPNLSIFTISCLLKNINFLNLKIKILVLIRMFRKKGLPSKHASN